VYWYSPHTLPLVTLNWSSYSGIDGGWGVADAASGLHTPIWAVGVRLFIMLFPVINILSVYPLVCVTLGDNMAMLIPPSSSWRYDRSPQQIKKFFRYTGFRYFVWILTY
jgi:hypothetical protein